LQGRNEVESVPSSAVLAQRGLAFEAVVVEPRMADAIENQREDNEIKERDTIENDEGTDELTDVIDEKRGLRTGNPPSGKRGLRTGSPPSGKRGLRTGSPPSGKRGLRTGSPPSGKRGLRTGSPPSGKRGLRPSTVGGN
jgi:hypothetical protein